MTKHLAFTLAALLVAAPVSAQALAPSVALIAGSALDLATTLHALRAVPGAREGNPLLSHGGAIGLVAVKASVTGVLVYSISKLLPRHRALANAIGYAGGGTLGLIALRNSRLK